MSLWNYIKADPFFRDILPHIKSHKFKIRGYNSRGNKIGFSDKELQEINESLKKLPGAKNKFSAK